MQAWHLKDDSPAEEEWTSVDGPAVDVPSLCLIGLNQAHGSKEGV